MSIETTELKIWLALRDKLQTFTGLPFIMYPHDAVTPPTDANGLADVYWILSDMRFDVPRKFVDTNASDTYQGEFQVHIMAPLRWTYEQQLHLAGQVIDHFPKDARLTYGGLDVHVTSTPKTIGGSYRDGAYNRLPVLVRWRASS